MAQKPAVPKGTRDFNPDQMIRRNYIFDTIKKVFKKYGYLPIETPSMENLSTLMGKYGEEGDKLIFKILNSGNFAGKVNWTDLDLSADKDAEDSKPSIELTRQISEKALRYDLTVPFARFVVQHRNDLNFPFKRYQIQPVWRADRPQKGRYREFYQCDVDVIGSDSLLNELELLQIVREVFNNLRIHIRIKLNNRKILAGIAEYIGHADKIIDITVAIDKLDKIGQQKVNEELAEKGLPVEAIEKLQPVLLLSGNTHDKLDGLSAILKESPTGLKGLEEMTTWIDLTNQLGFGELIELDLTLARGSNYYTGAIIEVKALDVEIGSICGGGRYDDLTGIFGLPDVSGVGVSFGADRIYDVLEQLNGYPEDAALSTQVLFVNFGEEEIRACLALASELRENNIPTEVYPDGAKMKKQLNYANARNIPDVVLAGQDELKAGHVTVKNMHNGVQENVALSEVVNFLAQRI